MRVMYSHKFVGNLSNNYNGMICVLNFGSLSLFTIYLRKSGKMIQVSCGCAMIKLIIQLIEAEKKQTPFRRLHFQMYLIEWKCLNFD